PPTAHAASDIAPTAAAPSGIAPSPSGAPPRARNTAPAPSDTAPRTRNTVPAPSGAPPDRPRRADARRNYELLLAAARDVFDEHGPGAPLDDIAKRAGVGNATMYRHFPTRIELIIAVYAEEVAALCAHGEDLLGDPDPGDALFTWLKAFIAHVATKRDLSLSAKGDPCEADGRSDLFARWHHSMITTASSLLDRARDAGAVRADLDVRDLLTVANGIALGGAAPDHADRLLHLVRHGTGPT
ncbi:TetR family transcriptional regulator, partial [Sphaerisporangium corydalis]